MKRPLPKFMLVVCLIAVPFGAVHAQAPVIAREAAAPAVQGATPTLKVTIVIARYSGEKKVSSLPFVMLLMPTDEKTTVQMSSSVPVPSGPTGPNVPLSYTYQSFGTQMTASAKELAAGQYAVSLSISDTQVLSNNPSESDLMKGLPRTQSFSSTVRLPLRDAQTTRYDAATDKLTGDIVRVEVTLNILK